MLSVSPWLIYPKTIFLPQRHGDHGGTRRSIIFQNLVSLISTDDQKDAVYYLKMTFGLSSSSVLLQKEEGQLPKKNRISNVKVMLRFESPQLNTSDIKKKPHPTPHKIYLRTHSKFQNYARMKQIQLRTRMAQCKFLFREERNGVS